MEGTNEHERVESGMLGSGMLSVQPATTDPQKQNPVFLLRHWKWLTYSNDQLFFSKDSSRLTVPQPAGFQPQPAIVHCYSLATVPQLLSRSSPASLSHNTTCKKKRHGNNFSDNELYHSKQSAYTQQHAQTCTNS